MKPEEHTPPQEPSSRSLLPVLWLLVAVAAPAAIVWFSGRDRAEPGEPDAARPEQVLAGHRAKVQEWLESYGWVDREGGIARVPIEEGMRAVLRDGLPAREEIEEER